MLESAFFLIKKKRHDAINCLQELSLSNLISLLTLHPLRTILFLISFESLGSSIFVVYCSIKISTKSHQIYKHKGKISAPSPLTIQ